MSASSKYRYYIMMLTEVLSIPRDSSAEMIKGNQKIYWRLYFNRALLYFEINHYDLAIEDFTRSLKEFDKESLDLYQIYLNRGYLYARQNNCREAVNDYKMAFELLKKNFTNNHQSSYEIIQTELNMLLNDKKDILDVDMFNTIKTLQSSINDDLKKTTIVSPSYASLNHSTSFPNRNVQTTTDNALVNQVLTYGNPCKIL
jgi:tetratricopeptide (TPR) repeat protein